jgi:hypothetical protein
MNAQWNPPTPIDDLFKQLHDGQLFAKDGKEDITIPSSFASATTMSTQLDSSTMHSKSGEPN